MTEKKEIVYVLDASAFVSRLHLSISGKIYTTQEIISEIKKGYLVNTIKTMVDIEKIIIREPNEIFLKKIKNSTFETGDNFVLSDADVSVLALSLELRNKKLNNVILTDDYAIQNVGKTLGLEYKNVKTKGIRQKWEWKIICPGCHREFDKEYKKGDECPICGTLLRRYHPPKRDR
ncbi:MAG: NOB1 family endonuclease [Candidatus Ranarchaeia archaeon]